MIHQFHPVFAAQCAWCRTIAQDTHRDPGDALTFSVARGWKFDGRYLACPRCVPGKPPRVCSVCAAPGECCASCQQLRRKLLNEVADARAEIDEPTDEELWPRRPR